MTGTDIVARAQRYVDDTIDSDDALVAINEAIDKLGDLGLIYESANITAGTANGWYPLPVDMTSLVSVSDGNGNNYEDFQQRGLEIHFSASGVYTVFYRKHPEGIAVLTETPPVHVSYHDTLCTYLKGWFKLKDDDESPDGLRLMSQFENDAAKVFSILRRKRGNGRITVMRAAIEG
jgi:hypothetical protein